MLWRGRLCFGLDPPKVCIIQSVRYAAKEVAYDVVRAFYVRFLSLLNPPG